MDRSSHVAIVVAIGKNRELGDGNTLLWHIPDDLKRFRRLTLGHPIIIGRKTFESILAVLGKPLPGRTNIVLTRDKNWKHDGVLVADTLEKALDIARQQPGADEIHIGGGALVYEQALPFVDRLYLTLVDDAKPADAFFPEYEHLFTKKISEESHEWEGLKYRWVNLERA